MIFTFKSKFSIFRHSEVLRLRREIRRKEKEWKEKEEKYVDAIATMRTGKPVFGERQSKPELQPTGYVPPTHPSRRPYLTQVTDEIHLTDDDKAQLEQFKVNEK